MKMICGRIISSAMRRSFGSSSFRTQPWNFEKFRMMSSMKAPPSLSYQQQQPQQGRPDLNLVARRFFHHENRQSHSQSPGGSSSMWSKALGALGALIGIGSGVAFHAKTDGHGLGFGIAHCQNRDKCEDKCIDKKCEDAPCLRGKDCEEEKIIQANCELEKVLKDVKSKAIDHTEIAMKAYCEAIELMKEFLNQGYCIIDNDELQSPMYEEAWCCLYDLAKRRCEKVRDALAKGMCAWELLCRLREVIESGKACKFTACNPLLKTATEVLTCAEKELLSLKSKMDCIGSDHEMVEQYKQCIAAFREDMKCEIDNLPENEKCDIQFCEQETALIVNEAYRKVIRVQKEMAQTLICQGNVPEKQATTLC